jgi:hypothetical protein
MATMSRNPEEHFIWRWDPWEGISIESVKILGARRTTMHWFQDELCRENGEEECSNTVGCTGIP